MSTGKCKHIGQRNYTHRMPATINNIHAMDVMLNELRYDFLHGIGLIGSDKRATQQTRNVLRLWSMSEKWSKKQKKNQVKENRKNNIKQLYINT